MRHWPGILALAMCASPAVAGPLAPCIRAGGSASGSFLAITDAEFPHALPAMADRVTLQVVPKETFVNDTNHKVAAPNTYWNGYDWRGWSVQLTKGDAFVSSCPLSLITDDGEFLILLDRSGINSAIRIYRRPEQGHNGMPVRDIALKEIWPPEKLQERSFMGFTDETPDWFAGSTFDFSSDSRILIQKSRWGNTVRIHLIDGSVSP
ncbi:MAG: hypothetical protein WB762_35140 [Candidatus Sulfotelmatobacter sp.]